MIFFFERLQTISEKKEIKREMDKLKEIIGQKKNEEIEGQKKEMHHEIRELKEQIAKMKVQPRPMPAELLNEMFASLPFENAFALFAKMPNLLLARNVRKMFKSVEMTMKKNKWNEADCGPRMIISEGGLFVEINGPRGFSNSIRAVSPIPQFILNARKPSVAAYFEVEIVHKNSVRDPFIQIGFCTQQFPLERKWLGTGKNSIGIGWKYVMSVDGQYKEFGTACEDFKVGDVIGLGVVHFSANSPMKCFATWNGQLLGTIELPNHFSSLQLFPAINLADNGDSIRANFGQEKWLFDPSQLRK